MTTSEGFPQVRINPDADRAALDWTNYVVVQAVQASLGLIGPDVLGIAVEARADGVTFHVALVRRSTQADQDVEDIVFEFDALTCTDMEGGVPVSVAITVGGFGPQWGGAQLRPIFLAHEPVGVAAVSARS